MLKPIPPSLPALQAQATYTVDGVPLEIRRPVTGVESNVPYGVAFPALAVVPALSVAVTPAHAVVPLAMVPYAEV